jgi:hypothetical protein
VRGGRFDRPNALVKKSQIGVTNAAANDADQSFILGKRMHWNFCRRHGLANLVHLPALNFAHDEPLWLKQEKKTCLPYFIIYTLF